MIANRGETALQIARAALFKCLPTQHTSAAVRSTGRAHWNIDTVIDRAQTRVWVMLGMGRAGTSIRTPRVICMPRLKPDCSYNLRCPFATNRRFAIAADRIRYKQVWAVGVRKRKSNSDMPMRNAFMIFARFLGLRLPKSFGASRASKFTRLWRPSSYLDTKVADGEMVEDLFEAILGRRIENETAKAGVDGVGTLKYWISALVNSSEFFNHFIAKNNIRVQASDFITDQEFRTPCLTPLEVPNKIIIVGSCMVQDWQDIIESNYPNLKIIYKIFNNASELETVSAAELASVGFQITQIPLRSLVAEAEYYSLHVDAKGKEELNFLFERATQRLYQNLEAALGYNHQSGLTTFVLNFSRPQSNPLGTLLPKYDLSNFSFFVAELNRILYEKILQERNVYLIDFDEIASTLGKRYILDDVTMHLNHGSFMRATNSEEDIDLTPYGSIESIFAPRLKVATLAIFRECLAAHRILSPTSKVNLVIYDLDGTLWRGVAAEGEEVGGHLNEGWPLGVLEAAAFLRKRGVLLAIASKNDPEIATRIWNGVYGAAFPLTNFVCVKISWKPKVESIAEILLETNLLAENVLFVDDNPVERERAKLAFPELRILEGSLSTWRRTLLWADELQTPYITHEAATRAESIQSMRQREVLRDQMNEADFLETLSVQTKITRIDSSTAPNFRRAIELLNKTNQFNTTGRRWAQNEIDAFFNSGGYMLSASVSDRHSNYGLTALALCNGNRCEQMVMSCRVFGLDVEFRLLEAFKVKSGVRLEMAYRATPKNGPARAFFEKIGLKPTEDLNGEATQTLVLMLVRNGART